MAPYWAVYSVDHLADTRVLTMAKRKAVSTERRMEPYSVCCSAEKLVKDSAN